MFASIDRSLPSIKEEIVLRTKGVAYAPQRRILLDDTQLNDQRHSLRWQHDPVHQDFSTCIFSRNLFYPSCLSTVERHT